MNLTPDQKRILQFLQENIGMFFTPTEIGEQFNKRTVTGSAWACNNLKQMVADELVKKTNRKKYGIPLEQIKSTPIRNR